MNSDNAGSDRFPLTKNSPASTDDAVSEPRSARTRRAASRARAARFWRTVRLVIASGMCLCAAIAGTFIGNLTHRSKFGGELVHNSFVALIHGHNPSENYTIDKQLPADKRVTVNLLMLGCDVDYENDRPVILKNSRGRSDSIMVAKLDFSNNKVSVLSIPRDTAVHIPDHGVNKINAANALEGPELTQQIVKDTFGIDTDYYVSINFVTFQKIVDQMGGVNLTVEKPLNYDDDWGHLHIHLKPGYQHLSGYQAMGYVRIRHSDDDLHRAARQHAFLEAMRDQVKSLSTFEKVPDLLNTLTDDVHSNLNMNQIAAIANWVRSVPKERVMMETMPSFEGRSYVTVNTPKAEEVVNRLFFDNMKIASINAPGMSVVDAITGHGKKHKHDGKQGAPKVVGSDEPLMPVSDGPPIVDPSSPDSSDAPTNPKSDPPAKSPTDKQPGKTDGSGDDAGKSNSPPDKGARDL